jgi:geranylgeranyl diphosphate synthase type I
MTAAPSPSPPSELARLAAIVRPKVEAALEARLADELARARAAGPDAGVVLEAISDLAVRGGKRLRAVLVCASHAALGGAWPDVIPAAVGFEILHAYFLAHDDWMDGDDVRRGGPSVHAALRERFGSERQGDVGAVLAGDWAAALAMSAVASAKAAPDRVLAAVQEVARVHADVVLGQVLDVRGAATDRQGVERVHALKTASYTVRGPLRTGALLAGAPAAVLDAIDRASTPAGIAFQLQDDLLGVFGDPAQTGKPRGSDLREGKRSAVVVEALADRAARPLLDRVLGVGDAPEEEIEALVSRLASSGVRARVEARVDVLFAEARGAASSAPSEVRALLEDTIASLVGRTR